MITWTENGEPWKEESRYSYVTVDGDVITPELYQYGGRAWFCASPGSMPAPYEVEKGAWPSRIFNDEIWSLSYIRAQWGYDPILPENNKIYKAWYSPHVARVPRANLFPALTLDIITEVYRTWYCGAVR